MQPYRDDVASMGFCCNHDRYSLADWRSTSLLPACGEYEKGRRKEGKENAV